MSNQYGDTGLNLFDEVYRGRTKLDFDELMILRSLRGKLERAQMNRRVRLAPRVGGFVW